MEIHFRNKAVRDLCERQTQAKKTLGDVCARKLWLRLQALEAAACVAELVAGNPHPLTGNRAGQFSLALAGGCRLTFSAGGTIPLRSDGSTDWPRVVTVCIEYIGDYHD